MSEEIHDLTPIETQKRQDPIERDPSRWFRYFLVAVSMLLLIVLLPLGYEAFFSGPGLDVLVSQHMDDLPPPPKAGPGVSAEAGEQWKKIATKYVQKKFPEATFMLESLLSDEYLDDEEFSKATFYTAICMMASDETSENALFYFDEILNEENSYEDETRWYKALTYLKLEDLYSARMLLNEVAASDTNPRKRDAEKLLKKF